MQHIVAVNFAKIVNKDIESSENENYKDFFAYVCKMNEKNLKITDDWFVKISERE